MEAIELLGSHLEEFCPMIHKTRLESVLEVATALQHSKNLSLTAMGRQVEGSASMKHKIKKVDRLEGNKHLHEELSRLYSGLSDYVFKYVSNESKLPILIDLCYIKDSHEVQMLSAEVALKGRSIPLYRDVFRSGDLKGRASCFLSNLSLCLPKSAVVIVIMDAGFGKDWFSEIESYQWYWLSRIREGKKIKVAPSSDWCTVKELRPEIGTRAKSYNNASIMIKHDLECRIVTKKKSSKNTKSGYKRQPRNYNAGNGSYQRSAKEPWILATNLPPSAYTTTKVINYYTQRMQIEESFRDLKSHQFGLGARYARTSSIERWGVKMLLAAIVQIVFWIIGIIGHSQSFQKIFQANTVKNKKIFSYFYLGKLIFEHDMLDKLLIDYEKLPNIIDAELARKW